MADAFAGDERVRFEIAEGPHIYTEVADHTVRWTHGDEINYQGGVGGISIPVRKAIREFNVARRADLTVFGHLHQVNWIGREGLGNGSLIGYGPFAVRIKAAYEPPAQMVAVIDADRGVRRVGPIMVEPKQLRWPEGRVA